MTVLADPSLLLLLPGAQQPVSAEAVAILPAHLPGVLWGDRVQPWRGALTACPSPPRSSAPSGLRPGVQGEGDIQPTLWQGVGGAPPLPSSGIGGRYHSRKSCPSPAEGPPGVPALASAAAQHFLHSLGWGAQVPKPPSRQSTGAGPWPES